MSDAQKPRLSLVDAVKGVALILVIMGHYIPETSPAWWKAFAGPFIYSFHMDVFFLISGYLFALGQPPRNRAEWQKLIGGKAKRLLIPCCAIALVYLLVKLPAQQVFTMTRPVTFQTVLNLAVSPQFSYVGFIWFMETLFILFALYGALSLFVRNKILLGCLLLAAPLLPPSGIPLLQLVCQYFPAFAAGTLLSRSLVPIVTCARRPLIAVLLLLAGAGMFVCLPPYCGVYAALARALGATLFLCVALPLLPAPLMRQMVAFGLYGYSIYLFHFIVTGTARKIVDQVLRLPEEAFWLAAIPVFLAALYLPLLFEARALSRYPRLQFMLIGEKISGKKDLLASLCKDLSSNPCRERGVGERGSP